MNKDRVMIAKEQPIVLKTILMVASFVTALIITIAFLWIMFGGL